jgi:hypothetical protein
MFSRKRYVPRFPHALRADGWRAADVGDSIVGSKVQ